jgi:plasmid stability protein
MATLFVENVPDDLYEALRGKARSNRTSIAAEVLKILQNAVPTPAELERRQALLDFGRKMRARRAAPGKQYPSAEQMLREDRKR